MRSSSVRALAVCALAFRFVTTDDWQVLDAHHLKLRAERGGGGRLYTVTIRCTDTSGNAASATTSVSVAR